MAGPMERLQTLDALEKEILTCLQSAGNALVELSKDKTSNKQVDNHTSNFLKTLNHVELELSKHINYLTQVSTGQAHEGSSYSSQKVLQMAWHRSEHTRTRVQELEKIKSQVLAIPNPRIFGPQSQGQPRSQAPSTPTTSASTPGPFNSSASTPGPPSSN